MAEHSEPDNCTVQLKNENMAARTKMGIMIRILVLAWSSCIPTYYVLAEPTALILSSWSQSEGAINRPRYAQNSLDELSSTLRGQGYDVKVLASVDSEHAIKSTLTKLPELRLVLVFAYALASEDGGHWSITTKLPTKESVASQTVLLHDLVRTLDSVARISIIGELVIPSSRDAVPEKMDLVQELRTCFSKSKNDWIVLASDGSTQFVDIVNRRRVIPRIASRYFQGLDQPINDQTKGTGIELTFDKLATRIREGEAENLSHHVAVHRGTGHAGPLAVIPQAGPTDWPGLGGRQRRFRANFSKDIAIDWESNPPRKRWLFTDAGQGFSSPAVVGAQVFLPTRKGSVEFMTCLNINDGSEEWVTPVGSIFDPACCCFAGPRGTPSVANGRVYFRSSSGDIACLNAFDGRKLWHRSVIEFDGKIPPWGSAESPLVHDDLVIFTPGGSGPAIVALDANDGSERWRLSELKDDSAYTSPIFLPGIGAEDTFAHVLKETIVIFDKNGKVLRQEPIGASEPLRTNSIYYIPPDRLYVLGRSQSVQFQINPTNGHLRDVFRNPSQRSYHAGGIVTKDHSYVLTQSSLFVVQSLSDGTIVAKDRVEHGNGPMVTDGFITIAVENSRRRNECKVTAFRLALGPDSGQSFLLAPRSRYLGFKKYNGIVAHPVVARDLLFVRDEELLHCFEL